MQLTALFQMRLGINQPFYTEWMIMDLGSATKKNLQNSLFLSLPPTLSVSQPLSEPQREDEYYVWTKERGSVFTTIL